MNNFEYIYGYGLGTYFEIPWFKYRGLDTKLNTIDSTYFSLFVKYGFLSLLIIFCFLDYYFLILVILKCELLT